MEVDDLASVRELSRFGDALAAAGKGVFLLDYDGTLAPFAAQLQDVRPWPGVEAALDGLAATGRARIVIVTGRYLRDAPPTLGTGGRFETWGSHGRERLWPDGRYELLPVGEAAVHGLAVADGWTDDVQAAGGRAEAKPGSLAFHWRGAGLLQIVRIRELVTGNFYREALEDVLELRNFDGGIELRAPGTDKGEVVRTLLRETPADVPVAFLGDDLTDEDAFRALGDRGLSVLVRPEFRPTKASLWIRPPEVLVWLLRHWGERICGVS